MLKVLNLFQVDSNFHEYLAYNLKSCFFKLCFSEWKEAIKLISSHDEDTGCFSLNFSLLYIKRACQFKICWTQQLPIKFCK